MTTDVPSPPPGPGDADGLLPPLLALARLLGRACARRHLTAHAAAAERARDGGSAPERAAAAPRRVGRRSRTASSEPHQKETTCSRDSNT
jgi:hypothetical protein